MAVRALGIWPSFRRVGSRRVLVCVREGGTWLLPEAVSRPFQSLFKLFSRLVGGAVAVLLPGGDAGSGGTRGPARLSCRCCR